MIQFVLNQRVRSRKETVSLEIAKQRRVPEYIGLPPIEARLWDAQRQGKLEAPLDHLGRADLDGLVNLLNSTVTSEYSWTSPFNDVHHMDHPAAEYADDPLCSTFRELMRRKAYVPRVFHNWTHYTVAPPPMPTREVMHHTIRAERTARDLAVTAQLAVRLTRMTHIPEAKLRQRLEEEFDNYNLFVENAREVPMEFRLLEPARVEARNIDEMLSANKRLGKLAVTHIPIRDRRLHAA